MVSLFTAAVSLACAYPGKGGQAKFISVDKGNTPWIRSGPIPGNRWSPIPVLTGPDRRTANKLIYQCVAIKSNGHQFSYKYKLCWCAQIYTIRAPQYSRLSVASGNRRRLWSKKLSSLFVVDYTTADYIRRTTRTKFGERGFSYASPAAAWCMKLPAITMLLDRHGFLPPYFQAISDNCFQTKFKMFCVYSLILVT